MKIITHSERFHADEVFASSLINFLFPIDEIIRTRDNSVILSGQKDKNTFVIDVGEKYNVSLNNFDHHQTDFNAVFNEKQWIKMSSCGLIWKHFGRDIIFKLGKNEFDIELDASDVEIMWLKLYQTLFLCIDANDNGIKQYKNIRDLNFKNNMGVYDIIAGYNRNIRDEELQLSQFKKAMDMAFEIFYNKIQYLIEEKKLYDKYLPDFLEALERAGNKQYIYVDDDDIMVERYLTDYDKEVKIKFMISKRYENHYRIYTRRKKNSGFELEKSLISQDNAKYLVGNDLIFIHKAGFVGASKTINAAQKIINASL